MRKACGAAVIASWFVVSFASAQTSSSAPDIGFEQYHDYHGGEIDRVNLDSGNLTLTIPVVSYPQRGKTLKVDFGVVYNGTGKAFNQSCITNPTGSTCTTSWTSTTSGIGMISPFTTSGGPALFDLQDMASTTKHIPYVESAPGYTNPYYNQEIWYTPDGGTHGAVQTSTGQISFDGTNIQAGFLWQSGLDPTTTTCTWDCSLSGVLANSKVMATQGGITYFGEGATTNGPIRMDMDGNYVSSNGSGYTDTTGRYIPFPTVINSPSPSQTAACTGSLPVTSINQWTPPGYSQPYVFCYATLTESTPVYTVVTRSGGGGSTSTVMGHPTQKVLQSIVLPNGQTWTFGYTESINNCPYLTGVNIGDLTHITFPTGGTIDYTYTCVSNGSSKTTAASSRTVNANDGAGAHAWNYSYQNNQIAFATASGTQGTFVTTLTDPLGNASVQTLNLPNFSRTTQQYSGSASGGSLMRTTTRNYFTQYSAGNGLPLFMSSQTVTLENGLSTQTAYQVCCDYSFNGSLLQTSYIVPAAASYGKITDTKTYDYATSGQGALLKETSTSYVFQSNANYMNPGLFDLVVGKTILNGSGTQMAQTTNGHDETGRIVSGIASLSGSQMTSPIYGVYGHLTSKTDWLNTGPSNPRSTTTYYDTGETYQSVDPLGHATSTYFCTGSSPTQLPCSASTYMGALPTVVSNALGQQTSFSYRSDTGQKLTVIDSNGETTTYAYGDSLNRLTSISSPDGGVTSAQYNDTGNIGVTVTQKVSGTLNKQTQTIVDGLGRDYESILLSDPSGATYTYTTYDALGRKYQVWNPTRCSPPTTNCGEATWGIATHQYDALNRETVGIPPDGSASANNVKTSYSGNTVTVTDEAANYRTSTSDALGRLTQVSEGSAGYITVYNYDALGNLTCVEQHGGVTGTGCSSPPSNDSSSPWRVRRFSYDSLSRLLTAKNPETGTISYGYNADGVLTSKTDNRGIAITYTPDALHRLTQKSYSDSEPTITYTYDAYTSGSNYGIGRRTGMSDGTGTTSWTYDTMGRVWSESKTIASMTKTSSTLYYYDGSDQQITYPSESASQGGHSVVLSITPNSSGSNTAGQILSIADTTNNITYASSISYAPGGAMANAVFGHSGSYSGIAQTNTYNSRGQPITMQACGLASCSGSNYLLSLTYNYGFGVNDNGNVQGITNNKNSARNQSFQYDGLNRLTQATSGSAWGVAFSYDPWGNLYQTNGVSGTGTNPMSVNQAINPQTNQFELLGYGYDTAGNVLTDGSGSTACSGASYRWNAEEQTACAFGATYSYDGDGARVEKNGGASTPTLYWGGLAESDLSGNITSEYIFMGGRRIARRDVSTGNVYYYFEDMLGSSSAVSTSAGSLANESDFYPFGGESVVTQSLSNQKFKFEGKERDSESGLDNFGARYYNSSMGRFQSPDWSNKADPIPYAKLGNPQSLNLYTYVQNNPESYADLDGHMLSLSSAYAWSNGAQQLAQDLIGDEEAMMAAAMDSAGQQHGQSGTSAQPSTQPGQTQQSNPQAQQTKPSKPGPPDHLEKVDEVKYPNEEAVETYRVEDVNNRPTGAGDTITEHVTVTDAVNVAPTLHTSHDVPLPKDSTVKDIIGPDTRGHREAPGTYYSVKTLQTFTVSDGRHTYILTTKIQQFIQVQDGKVTQAGSTILVP